MNVITQFSAARDSAFDLRFQAMFAGAAIGIGICQLDGRILDANPALSTMLGCSPEDLTGTHIGELDPEIGVHPSPGERLRFERSLDELIRNKRASFESEKRFRRKDGSQLWGHLTISLGRDARRQPAFLIAILQDATERRQLEEHLHQAEKMELIGRLAGGIAHDFNNLLTGILLYCDLLSAGLEKDGLQHAALPNHALSNDALPKNGSPNQRSAIPAPANRNSANQRSKNVAQETSELCRHVEEVRMAGEQGAALTRQLLSIARKQVAEPRPILLNEIVASTENLLRRLIGEQIELVIILDDVVDDVPDDAADDALHNAPPNSALNSPAGLVLADPAQLRQILMNLVLNARDAMPPQGGKIRLSTRSTEFPSAEPDPPKPDAPRLQERAPHNARARTTRRAVSLAVQDNGSGMNAETRARLFEPFFTTKNPAAGTGLGLATVQRIVNQAGGLIRVQSEPGHGARIEIFLPEVFLPEVSRPAVESALPSSKNSTGRNGSG